MHTFASGHNSFITASMRPTTSLRMRASSGCGDIYWKKSFISSWRLQKNRGGKYHEDLYMNLFYQFNYIKFTSLKHFSHPAEWVPECLHVYVPLRLFPSTRQMVKYPQKFQAALMTIITYWKITISGIFMLKIEFIGMWKKGAWESFPINAPPLPQHII